MLRKYLYVGLFAVVCVGLVAIILFTRMEKITPIEVMQAVPEDVIVLAENVDYEYLAESFIPGSRIWIDWVNTSGFVRTDSVLKEVLARVRSSRNLENLLLKEGLSLSLHLVGKDQIVPLFFIPYAGYFSDNEFEEELLSLLGQGTLVNDRKYETEVLYDVSGSPGSLPGKFTFSCVNGICLISPSSMLVEASVRSIHDELDPSSDEELQQIRGTAGKYVHANFYINYRRIDQLFKAFVKAERWEILEGLSMLADWGELDLDIKEDAMILNGMTLAGKEEALFFGALRDQSPVKMELHELMPSGTSWFMHLGISNPEAFRQGMEAYLSGKGTWEDLKAESEKIFNTYGVDLIEDLFAIMDDEMTWFAVEGETKRPAEEIFMVETRSRSETQELTRRWIEAYLKVNAFDMESFRSVYRLDNQTSFDIYRMPAFYKDKPLTHRLFGSYFTIYENSLMFGPSVEMLSRVIYQNVLHKTFVSDPVFKEMSDYLANRSNLTLFFRPYSYLDYRKDLLNPSAVRMMDKSELFLRRIPGIVIQYSSEGELLYQSISIKYAAQIREKALTVWESLLDTVAVIKPALVLNHMTQEKEIFVQDASNKIYLINSTGRILWDMKLEGPIMGSVSQVDFYKNGKLQYLFNTAEKLHLIDRNGNYVERYPISLRSPATSPIALFDYDNSRDYRIFVAGQDRRIYAYNIEGDVITGWKFGKTESIVTREPQHFRIGDKDYIIFSDATRPYILDRKGSERVRPEKRVVFSEMNPFSLDMNIRENRPRWISTDTAGNVVCVYLDGKVSTLLERDGEPGHFFRMLDMNMDGVPDYIFAEGNELSVITQDGKRLFSYRVRDRISEMPDIYKFSASDIKIGITDRTRNRIYLINGDGSLYEGFPLEGSTRFSIGYFAGSDSRFNLIVGSSNNFLYNYSIE